jgi:pyoverdine/dityrosine biosynthesis protein Dit1
MLTAGAPPVAEIDTRASVILEILHACRRPLPVAANDDGPLFHPSHRERIRRSMLAGVPIHLVLPAFPAKSANPLKTLGELPDLGEWLSLRFLDDLCRRIATCYRPGVRLTICSDGRVFSDLVGVPDEGVTRYRNEMRALIERGGFEHLDLIDLDDLFALRDYATLREELLVRFGDPIESLREQLLSDPAGRALLDGIHRFLFDDMSATVPALSRSRTRAITRSLAYRTIQRSKAWSAAVERRFPDAVRLSIHPQPAGAPKLGISLLPAADVWMTPWHGVVLDTGTEFRLVKRIDAEASKATLAVIHGRPGYFVAAGVRPQELAL